MSNEYNCFVISPVGEPNSKIREAADALLEYLGQHRTINASLP